MKPYLQQNVFLIGFMGAGKTTVSRRLAQKCSCASVDLDFFIERNAGMPVSKIFDIYGENGFRDMETESLEQVCSFRGKSIISCGGAVVVRQKNIEIMKNNGVIVHLLTDVESSFERITDKSTRPLFSDRDTVQKRYDERIDLYNEAADIVIDTRGQTTSNVVYFCQRELSRRQILIYK